MLLIKAVRKDGHHPATAWEALKHPRDAHGRFIEVGHKVTLADGSTGTVVRTVGSRTVEVRNTAGHVVRVASNTVSSGEPGHGGGLAGMKFPAGRKLTVTHGPHDTPLLGHVTNTGDHLAVEPVKGGPVHHVPHSQVNRVYEAPGREGRPGAVRYVRPGWQSGRTAGKPEAQVSQARARDLKTGDRIIIPHPETGEPGVAEVLGNEPRGDSAELDVRHGDRTESYYLTDRSAWIDRLDNGTVFPDETETTPDPVILPPVAVRPLPDGTTIARPVLYTYQRQKITALNLDRDRSLPADVIQAAARIRQRQSLSAGQAAALSAALREHAASSPRAVERRSLERTAHRIGAAAAEAHGHVLPQSGIIPDHATPVTPAGITEGDHIILADATGKLAAAKVRGITPLMGGRLALVDLEHDDGTRETRTVTGKTRTWLIPDRPDDIPVPPGTTQPEHITADQVRPGDTIRRAAWQGSASPAATVASITQEHGNPEAVLDDGTRISLESDDGGPSVVRTARGPASSDQPWDSLLPAEQPEQDVPASTLRTGDRITVDEGEGLSITGTIQEASHGERGTFLVLRSDDSHSDSYHLKQDDTVTRLVKGDANAEARIAEARAAREHDQKTAEIASAIGTVLDAARGGDLYRAAASAKDGDDNDALTARMNSVPPGTALGMVSNRADLLASLLTAPGLSGSEAEAARRETAARLAPVLTDLISRQRAALIESLLQSAAETGDRLNSSPQDRKDPAGPILKARNRVLAQWRDTPPPLPVAAAARSLAGTALELAGHRASTESTTPDTHPLPGDADLAGRIRAYRSALPADCAAIGKITVTRAMITKPNLADLEAGKAPGIEQVQVNIPDRATDGGPGAVAMRHLDTVMAAGRDLDAELQRRISAAGATPEPPEKASARTAEIAELSRQRIQVSGRARETARRAADAHVRASGFSSIFELHRLQGKAHYGGDRAEAARLQAVIDAAEAAGTREASEDSMKAETLRSRLTELRAEATAGARRAADGQRQAALEVLRQVRPDGVGGTGAKYRNATGKREPLSERSEQVKAMRWAEQHYPAGWLEKFRDHAPAGYSLGPVKRGHYSDSKREIRLSSGTEKVTGAGEWGDVAIHEAGHAMEQSVPGVLALEDAYLWSRTSSGNVGARTREKRATILPGETAYKDEFPESYSGKDYPRGGKDGMSDAYELLTTGVESLFGGARYLDDSMRQWLLGTLALVD